MALSLCSLYKYQEDYNERDKTDKKVSVVMKTQIQPGS
jgi:hypothetical protein